MNRCLIVVVLWSMALPQETRAQNEPSSLAVFVRSFYGWYAPLASKDNGTPGLERTLTDKRSSFSAQLLGKLQEDVRAQAAAKGEIVRLEFDPFLASQDPCVKYQVGKVTKKGTAYLVDVYSLCGGRRERIVEAEVVSKNGRWIFVNFHYPLMKSDLLSELALTQADRHKRI